MGGEVEAPSDGAVPRAPRRCALLLRPDHRHRHIAGACYAQGMTAFGPADPDLRLSAICRTAAGSGARPRRRVGLCRRRDHRATPPEIKISFNVSTS
jgi:hypothetical protein